MKVDERQRSFLRIQTFSAYDLQKLRMQCGLRLCASFRAKLKEDETEEEIDRDTGELSERAERMIDKLKASYKTLTEGVARNRNLPPEQGFTGDSIISEFTELVLVDQYMRIDANEKLQFRQLESTLAKISVYELYLKEIRGIGPAMAAVL